MGGVDDIAFGTWVREGAFGGMGTLGLVGYLLQGGCISDIGP